MLVFIPGGHDFTINQDLDKEKKVGSIKWNNVHWCHSCSTFQT